VLQRGHADVFSSEMTNWDVPFAASSSLK